MKIIGKVIKGRKKGRKLGFPTANIRFTKKLDMDSGVYSGTVETDDGEYQAAIFVNPDGLLLEAHLLSYNGDLYNKTIKVIIIKKIRRVQKFDSDQDLINQITKDIQKITW